jgi:hypothetical protein
VLNPRRPSHTGGLAGLRAQNVGFSTPSPANARSANRSVTATEGLPVGASLSRIPPRWWADGSDTGVD